MIFQDTGLKDKVAIVTGGSRGIGREIVRQLAQEGAIVHFLFQKNKNMADGLVDEAQSQGWSVNAHQVDVKDKEQCQELTHAIFEKHKQIDILVNNSGIVRDNLLVGLEKSDIQEVIDTNILGVFHMTQAIVPFMMSRRSGKIINMSSVAAEKGGRGQANYVASKGALNAFTKAMAVELAARNIKVNAVAPGIIETDISQEVRELAAEESLSKILLKRYGKPEEVAYLVVFLASRFAEYITGQIFHIDGGFKMA